MSFSTYPAASAITAAIMASSSSYAVSMMQRTSGATRCSSRQRSMPLPSGSRTSSSATVGLRREDPAAALGDRARLTDDADVRVRLEQLRHTAPHQLVVVDEDDGRGPVMALPIRLAWAQGYTSTVPGRGT